MSDSTPATLRSVCTNNLPTILDQLGIGLATSTYQASRVILIRNHNGQLNTNFRNLHKPMGIALHQNKLSVGGATPVWPPHFVTVLANVHPTTPPT